ncbi:uncharacterized protein LOC111790548 isoform X2 [Cucurbita pepo subsp. pepo]|uniref:uncharacterized protein LOC111790548 isoform X2 n=1 Tax=Cucurbita pepo subsp. pepo TaxID=3664 RepID=UPI000C9DA1D8|nr:uncharacterized protein LOC111790548 isoform X2 [Cucurbita pepo subsp. pepo]
MKNKTESASTSSLAWRWTIEALASFEEVKPSLLHELLDGTRKNAGEMVALKCLEGLFGSLNYIGENVLPVQESKVMFDSSESCEDVFKRIYKETPKSSLRVAGPDLLKWDVRSFTDQKRASMRCTLHKLKDAILDGTHPYADFLMQKSGLTPINKRDNICLNNEDCIELSGRLDISSSGPRGQNEKGKGSPLLEDDRRISVVNPPSSSLLPSKRSGVDFTSEDEARQLPGWDDGYINVKKLKQHSAHTSFSGQEVASSHETEVLEDSPERRVPQNERDDTDRLDEHQITSVDDELVEDVHFGSKKSHQDQSGIPCYTMPASTRDDEMLEVVCVEKVKDGSELPFEPKTSNPSPAEGNLHNTSPDNSKCDSGHDYRVNETNTMSPSGFMSKTVATNMEVGVYPDVKEKDLLSDSDGYHETIDIATRKKEFLSSQCMVDHDSFPLADSRVLAVCVKCNEGGQLLCCNISDCPLVVHAKCLSSSASMTDEGDFCCPFCLYSLAISEYLEAKKHVASVKKNVASFFRTALGHQSAVLQEVLQQKDVDASQRAVVEDVAKICEDVDLESKDNQVSLDGERVNEVVDYQSTTDTDTEQMTELSKPLHIANSNHRQNKASPSRVASDALLGQENGYELVDQECQGNTVAGVVDQKCRGNVAEQEDGQKDTEQHDIYEILHEGRGPVEPAATQNGLQYQTDDSEGKAARAIITEGEKSSDDGNDESIISRYSIRFRQKCHHTSPETHPLRRKKLAWTAEEEETIALVWGLIPLQQLILLA